MGIRRGDGGVFMYQLIFRAIQLYKVGFPPRFLGCFCFCFFLFARLLALRKKKKLILKGFLRT